jgi:hypothetical protein
MRHPPALPTIVITTELMVNLTIPSLSTIFQYNMAVIIFKPNLYTRDILTVSLQFENNMIFVYNF